MKALEILTNLLKQKYDDRPFVFGVEKAHIEIDNIHEAIAELEEAIKPKTCDGCKTCEHYSNGTQSDGFSWEKCDWYWECKRKYEDRYEPKATT